MIDLYVAFPFQTVDALNNSIQSGKVRLASSQHSFLKSWMSDATEGEWFELKNTLKQYPIIALKFGADFCDYRNHSVLPNSN